MIRRVLVFCDLNKEDQIEKTRAIIKKFKHANIGLVGSGLHKIVKNKVKNVGIVPFGSEKFIEALFFSEAVFVLNDSTNLYKYNQWQRTIRWCLDEQKVLKQPDIVLKKKNSYDVYTDIIVPDIEEHAQLFFTKTAFHKSLPSYDEQINAMNMIDATNNNDNIIMFFYENIEELMNSSQVKRVIDAKNEQIDLLIVLEEINDEAEKYSERNKILLVDYQRWEKNIKMIAKLDKTFVLFQKEEDRLLFSNFDKERIILAEEFGYPANGEGIADSYMVEMNSAKKRVQYFNYLENLISRHDGPTKVAIIIPHYNYSWEQLARAIESARHTKYIETEIIVVDDGAKESFEERVHAHFKGEIKYFRKENEGVGLARNFGVRNTNAEYIFFLDSDDEIYSENLHYLVAHSISENVKVVAGKRILVDCEGKVRHESLRYVYSNIYRNYTNKMSSIHYADQMVNNKLCHRSVFTEDNIWFLEGLYEDANFTTQLYTQLNMVSFLNVGIHKWYRYGENTTISSTATIKNFKERIRVMGEEVWPKLPEDMREIKIRFNVTYELVMYFKEYRNYTEFEKRELFEEVRKYLDERIEYVNMEGTSDFTEALVHYAEKNDFTSANYLLEEYSRMLMKYDENASNFFAGTYYHILIAILYTIENNLNSNLYIDMGFIDFPTAFLNILREQGIFNNIVTYTNGEVVSNLLSELDQDGCKPDIAIPHHIYNYYSEICEKIHSNNMNYIFNDGLPIWYYLEREFNKFIKLEDAYNSFEREAQLYTLNGIWGENIRRYVPELYPEVNYLSEKVEQIIVSHQIKGLKACYQQKLKVIDTNELMKKHEKQFSDILMNLFQLPRIEENGKKLILLTQPLDRSSYCTTEEQVALYKSMLDDYKEYEIYIKPHPADTLNYSKRIQNAIVLDRHVPIEVYNYGEIYFDIAVSFGSTSLESLRKVGERKMYFKMNDFTREDVSDRIKEILEKNGQTKKFGEENRSKNVPSNSKSSFSQSLKRRIKRFLN